jgi:large subunit ribosomal protein L10
MPAEKAKKLAEVPSFEESMSMVAGALESITSQVAKGVKEVPSQVARGVSEVSQKGE